MSVFHKKRSDSSKKKKSIKKVSIKVLVISSVIVLVVAWIVAWTSIYLYRGTSDGVRKLSGVIPYPAFKISSTDFISLGGIDDDVRAIEQFYTAQDFSQVGMRIDFSTEQGKKRLKVRERMLINKRIEERAIEDIVHEQGQQVTKTEVAQNIERKLSEYGTEESVKGNLERLYGWSLDDFSQKVVKPELYKDKAQKIFGEGVGAQKDDEAQKKIMQAFEEIGNGVAFADVAEKYSEGSSVESGGRVGFVALDQIEPALAAVLPALPEGSISRVIETELGYHILAVHALKEQTGETFYDVSQVFTRKYAFVDYLTTRVAGLQVTPLLREYVWDQNTGLVNFKDEEMVKFEKEIFEELSQELGDTGV